VIDPSDIASLAELYDRYANALERLSSDRLAARRQFFARLEFLHEREAPLFRLTRFDSRGSSAVKIT
jgi:hypothetical protein